MHMMHMMHMACRPAGSPESGRVGGQIWGKITDTDYKLHTPYYYQLVTVCLEFPGVQGGGGNLRLHKSTELTSPEGVPFQPQT